MNKCYCSEWFYNFVLESWFQNFRYNINFFFNSTISLCPSIHQSFPSLCTSLFLHPPFPLFHLPSLVSSHLPLNHFNMLTHAPLHMGKTKPQVSYMIIRSFCLPSLAWKRMSHTGRSWSFMVLGGGWITWHSWRH